MALDATVAGASADSYLTVEEADALNDAQVAFSGSQAAAWAAADTSTKEALLRAATIDIDAYVRSGPIYISNQRLRFPRAIDVDADDAPFLHWRVTHATYEQAAYLLLNGRLIEGAARRRARGMFSFNEDDISGTLAIDPQVGLIAPQAEQLLAGLVPTAGTRAGGIGSVRVRSRYASPSTVTLP